MPRKPSRNGGSAARFCDHKSLIPDTFMLAGTVWSVVKSSGMSELGRCERDRAVILLKADVPDQVMASTFFHELVHAILFAQGKTEHDEREIDSLGQFLHQFNVTRGP
jgi:hypothetical protein